MRKHWRRLVSSCMPFSFVHAADLHLGSPFEGLSIRQPEIADKLSLASRSAFVALVDEALARKVNFFLIAGDVYDGAWRDTSIGLFFHREVSRLVRGKIPVYTVRGNHDADSVLIKSIRPPDGLFEFPSAAASSQTLPDLKVIIHGRSFPTPAVGADFVQSYIAPRAGWFNIGLLHTACEPDPSTPYAPCSLHDLVSKGYQYWALGHVHAYAELHADPHVVFPGNLQGRGIHECDSKGALLVQVDDGVVRTERLLVDHARWLELQVDLENVASEDALHDVLRDHLNVHLRPHIAEAGDRPLLVRLVLRGTTSLHGRLRANTLHWQTEAQSALHEFGEDVWIEQLKIKTTAPVRVQAQGEAHSADALGLHFALEAMALSEDMVGIAKEYMQELTRKLPAGCVRDEFLVSFDAASMVAEARDLLGHRLYVGDGDAI